MKLNFYKYVFCAYCPDNNLLIDYQLTIESKQMINVFDIQKFTSGFERGYHEDFADMLFDKFRGKQVIEAHHHGFFIRTVRSEEGATNS
jgi:hypothetical protein